MTPAYASVALGALSTLVALGAVIFGAGSQRAELAELRARGAELACAVGELRSTTADLRVHLAALAARCPVCRSIPPEV